RHPLLIDADMRLHQASRMVVGHSAEKAYERFVITDRGRYAGLGRIIDLLHQLTDLQISTARHANPLSGLPGNVPLYAHINSLLQRDLNFVLVLFDLDSFKPFNDYYGYAKGDEALYTVARLLSDHAGPKIDFVGHVGGDDFLVVFRSADWELRVKRMFSAFTRSLPSLYVPEHLRDGGLTTRDRYGVERHFPLLSMSAAGLVCEPPIEEDAESLAFHLAPLRTEAKQHRGNTLRQGTLATLTRPEPGAGEVVHLVPNSTPKKRGQQARGRGD
ncbi:MAG: GGDEF domain-containing protein, partial [Pseudomonadota bacterium]